MNKLLVAALAGASIFAVAPANAGIIITPGGASQNFFGAATTFDASTRGVLLATDSQAGTAPTIAGILRSAVYRNTSGTLDFYFQVARTGGSDMIDGLNVGNYLPFSVEGFTDGTDFDGAGIFTAANNPAQANEPQGPSTTVAETSSGVVQLSFGVNGLRGTETSTTYILRTNALNYSTAFATVTNSTSFNAGSFSPVVAVPEPATWGMLLVGFGLVGAASRRSRKVAAVAA